MRRAGQTTTIQIRHRCENSSFLGSAIHFVSESILASPFFRFDPADAQPTHSGVPARRAALSKQLEIFP
jgi:hypothetical protein